MDPDLFVLIRVLFQGRSGISRDATVGAPDFCRRALQSNCTCYGALVGR